MMSLKTHFGAQQGACKGESPPSQASVPVGRLRGTVCSGAQGGQSVGCEALLTSVALLWGKRIREDNLNL